MHSLSPLRHVLLHASWFEALFMVPELGVPAFPFSAGGSAEGQPASKESKHRPSEALVKTDERIIAVVPL